MDFPSGRESFSEGRMNGRQPLIGGCRHHLVFKIVEHGTISLEDHMPLKTLARLVLAAAYENYRKSFKYGYDFQPKPGDWIFETSTIVGAFLPDNHPNASDPLMHFGIFLRREPHETDSSGIPYYWIIQLITGEEQRWGNAGFAAIPPAPYGAVSQPGDC